ncbi:InlB B-repeat-containing protein [Eubacteriaceae bacterium ES2]|nr:InlB B-repeat-containing protein [Eubacteriaceae bacterium ES2]
MHVQNKGWMDAVSDGTFAGTSGEGLRIESIKISLTNLDDYDVYYRGHVQNVGNIPQVDSAWGWVKNGEELGTTGDGLRLEELEIKIVRRDTDLTAYNDLMNTITNLSADDYTQESWQALQTTISDYPVTEASLQEDVDMVAEMVQLSYDDLEKIPLETVAVYDTPGIFGPEAGSEVIEGSVVISVSGVTLQNLEIMGNLTIADTVGDGNATLNNLTVHGDTIINGGGMADSAISANGILGNIMTMETSGGIVINGGEYDNIKIDMDANGGLFISCKNSKTGAIKIETFTEGQKIILDGEFGTVSTFVKDLDLEVTEGSYVNKAFIGFNSSRLTISGQGSIGRVTDNYSGLSSQVTIGVDVKATDFSGNYWTFTGTVDMAIIRGDDATFTGTVGRAGIFAYNTIFRVEPEAFAGREPIIDPTLPVPDGEDEEDPGDEDSDDGGDSTGGGGGGVTYTAVSGVAITGNATVGQTLTVATTPAGATVSYQWMSCATIDGTYNNILSATASSYTLVSGDAGKYIKVQVTGNGTYNGTVASAATGLVLPSVTGVTVKTVPTKTTYSEGQTLDLSGLVVTLTKSDTSTEDVEYADFASKGLTTSPANGATLATTDTSVTITHTASSQNANQAITVNTVTVTGVTVKTAPTKTTYIEGQTLDLSGLVVTLSKSNLSTEDVAFADFASKGLTTSPANGATLVTTNTNVTITYTASSQNANQAITVNALAGSLTVVSANPGTTIGTTILTISGSTGGNMFYQVGDTEVSGLTVEDAVTGVTTFVSGTTEIGVTANQYITVYELDGSNKVVKYVSYQVSSSEIKAAASYTVTFAAGTSNNALADITGATNYVASDTATEGQAYTAPVLSQSGYTFNGWFTDAACSSTYTPAADAITGNITLYASFTAVNNATFTNVTYDDSRFGVSANWAILELSGLTGIETDSTFNVKDKITFQGLVTYTLSGEYTKVTDVNDVYNNEGKYYYDSTSNTLTISILDSDESGIALYYSGADKISAASGWNTTTGSIDAGPVNNITIEYP